MLVDEWGVIFGSSLLTATPGVLVGTSVLEAPVWRVTVPPAVIMLTRDAVYGWTHLALLLSQNRLILK